MKSLRESMGDLGAANPNRVDRERGLIRGVKVVGMQSRNKRESKKGRRYTRACLGDARRLYEGLKVRCNHPSRVAQVAGEDRKTEDVLGQLENVRLGADGLYGDLRYLKSHPLAERLCEAAERMPGAFGLSHDVAKWQGDYDGDGVYVITAIEQVDGVDLVDSPGTTNGLFESEGKVKTKKPKAKPRIKLDDLIARLERKGALRESLEKLREAGDVDGGMMLGEGADPEASVNSAFMTACQQVLMDGKSDRKAKLGRLGSILEAQEKLIASGALTKTDAAAGDEPPPDEGTESDDDGEGDDPDPDEEAAAKKAQESLRAENARLKLRESCGELARTLGLTPTALQLQAMMGLATDADRKKFLRESVSGNAGGGGNKDDVTDGKSLARRVVGSPRRRF